MKINRAALINATRGPVFGGAITLEQSAGLAAICDEWELRELTDARWLADILGQSFWESARTLQPVREAFYLGAGAEAYWKTLPYYPYYGRGLIQVTWLDNYMKMQARLGPRFPGLNIVDKPDDALRPDVSIAIVFEGMIHGMFTGAKLSDYFTDTLTDFPNSRRIVNGTDHMFEIATLCEAFWAGLGGPEHVRWLHFGDRGDDVRLVQDALKVQGLYMGADDGDFGPATRAAVFAFQRAKELDVDGVVGPATREELLGT